MTHSNRFINRLLLLVIGVLALAVAVILAVPRMPWITDATGVDFGAWIPALPDLATAAVLWIVAGVAVVVAALSIVWILSRGRGRTSQAVVDKDIVIDAAAIAGILRTELEGQPDVLAVSAQGYRRFGGAVLVRIESRTRADLSALLTRIRAAVDTVDTTIGAPVPLVIHLATGVRTAMTGSRTTH